MENRAPKLLYRVLMFGLLVLCLVAVRLFESKLFYDPFLAYFKGEYAGIPIPSYDLLPLIGSLTFRYGINSLISLAMLYVAFWDKKVIKFAGIMYVILFVILLAALLITLGICADCKLAIFYERRFLIQPLFVLLFLPAFYYQRYIVK